MSVTIKDIADKTGFSVVTVSRALNDVSTVRDKNKKLILKAAKELNYTPNTAAKALAKGRTGVIAVVLPVFDDFFVIKILSGIEREAKKSGSIVVVSSTGFSDHEDEAEQVKTLSSGLVDGLLIVTPRHDNKYIKELKDKEIPFILVDKRVSPSEVTRIAVDNKKGAQMVTEHLLSLGHRRIGFIVGDVSVESSLDRLNGFKETLEKHKINYNPNFIKMGEFSQSKAYKITKEWLESNPPTAIFASADIMALGAMEAIKASGFSVPGDITVFGLDDEPFAADTHPPLSTVKQPLEKMGQMAMQLLTKKINGDNGDLEKKIILDTELVIRDSCKRRKKSGL